MRYIRERDLPHRLRLSCVVCACPVAWRGVPSYAVSALAARPPTPRRSPHHSACLESDADIESCHTASRSAAVYCEPSCCVLGGNRAASDAIRISDHGTPKMDPHHPISDISWSDPDTEREQAHAQLRLTHQLAIGYTEALDTRKGQTKSFYLH
jgi:hypothetical protein